ncbi:MAG TPA: DNA polymerase III subunit delta [Chloroflexi bacterium]|nr:DNA polymerase III subunit delta [Chloroflexota bacterium]HBY08291.1 DNA polymerase III subunit delta [Chloroflexota bacterium]
MSASKPVVYIFHGDDEFALGEAVNSIRAQMGDATTAEMNTTRLEGRNLNLDDLVRATRSLPFLAERRLVVLTDPLGSLKTNADRDKFKKIMEETPATTALAVRISSPLLDARGRRSGKTHWLEKWAAGQAGKAYVREYSLPKGPQMANWIRQKAKESGGEFNLQAAALLGIYVGDDPRLAAQEIEKLLAYVNYQRPVEPDDVEHLVAYAGETSVFEMVDALGARNGREALRLLHRLLAEDDPLRLFGMVTRQFRLLLQTRELIDAGNREQEIASTLKIHPFVVQKLMGQVRNFSLPQLETIYHKLLEIDEAIKTGQTEGDVALETLVAALTV